MHSLAISLENLVAFLLKEGSASIDFLKKMLSVEEQILISALNGLDGIEIIGDIVKVTNRIKLAISAIEKGVEPKNVSIYLDWKEFEDQVSKFFEEEGYIVLRSFRTSKPKKTETDVLAQKGNIVIVVDCKHWDPSKSGTSRYIQASKVHFERVMVLVNNEKFITWVKRNSKARKVFIFPVLISLSIRAGGINQWATIIPISHLSYIIQNFNVFTINFPHISIEL